MSTFLSLLRRFARSKSSKHVAPARPRFRPCLEALEDRVALSTFFVLNNKDDGSTNSLRWAVSKAVNNGDIIDLTVPAVLRQTIVLTHGELNLNSSVTIETLTTNYSATISGGGNTQLFSIAPNTAVVFKNLNLTGGYGGEGGAIYNEGALTLNNCNLTGNHAYYEGGAIFNAGVGGEGAPVGNVKTAATIGGEGGSNAQLIILNHSTLSGNTAALGGAIYNYAPGNEEDAIKGVKPAQLSSVGEASVMISGGSILSGNTAFGYYFYDDHSGAGGAVFNEGGTVTVSGGSLSGNTAAGNYYAYQPWDYDYSGGVGGAIYNDYGSVTIQNGSTLTGNTAAGGIYFGGQGGGIYNYYGNVTISGSSLTSNTAADALFFYYGDYGFQGEGGGVYNNADFYPSLTVNQGSHITGNHASKGPDVAAFSGSYSIVPITQIGTPVYNI